jgi:hypothetical protein
MRNTKQVSANYLTADLRGQKITAGNSTYPKGAVSCFADTFVQGRSSVLRMKFSGKNPAHPKSANRYA